METVRKLPIGPFLKREISILQIHFEMKRYDEPLFWHIEFLNEKKIITKLMFCFEI